jgi:PhoH-like ATPase
VIPITVLEELDHFKKGSETVNYHAREFLRALDALSGDKLFREGVQITPYSGRVSIELDQDFHEDLRFNFSPGQPDHRILNSAFHVAQRMTDAPVVLISKDVNLRMKAKAIGLAAQDYTTDQVRDITGLYVGHRTEDAVAPQVIDQMYQDPYELDIDTLAFERALCPNEYVILRNGKKSALACYNDATKVLRRVDKEPAYGIRPRNAEQTFAINALLKPDVQLVSMTGKAGTGKTLLALATALQQHQRYQQICMARPIIPLSNRDIGYLPGDIESKIGPYMQPLYDNLGVIQSALKQDGPRMTLVQEMLEDERLKITPLSYIRGRSLVNVFFIVDESQNLTPHEVKTIITRAGEGTKIVFTGDIFQIDHPYLDSLSNGLSYLIEKMHGQRLYAHITLEKGERSELADLASDLL